MPEEIKNFVNAEDILETLRDNNMTTLDSICELIDNSLDHSSRNVWIEFDADKKSGQMWLIVQDDGDGIEKENIKKALSLGGTMNPRDGHSTKIGRFGMGLSNACASQSPRSILASMTKNDKKIWTNEIDFDYLKKNKAEFAPTYELKDEFLLSKIKFNKSGTVVYWSICDNLDKKKLATMHKHLMESISEIYRYFINGGKNIFVNGIRVELFDPLCRLENHRFKGEYGIEKLYCDPIIVPVEYVDNDGNMEKSNVVVEIVLMDYDKIMNNPVLGDKLKIGMRNQGFYLIRNDREININGPEWYSVQQQRIDHLNYIRGEIRFESKLDKSFGIGHNKSRAYPKDVILEALKNEVSEKIIAALSEHKRRRLSRDEDTKGGSEPAKKIHESASERIVPDDDVLITEKGKRIKKDLKTKTREEIEDELTRSIDTNPTISPATKERRKEQIKKILEDKYKQGIIMSSDGPQAPFFRIDVADGKRIIMVNGDHKFFEYVYEPATDSAYSHALIDLALYTLADVREGLKKEEYMELFDQIMERFSKRYGAMFNQKEFAELLAETKKD